MTFLSPLWLIGIAGILVPLAIHLLFKRKFVIVHWAAAEFLLKAFQKQKKKLVIENLILMLLRMGILLCLALAFAVPVLRSFLVSGLGEGTGTTVVILDNSYSMGAKYGSSTVFEAAKKHCINIMEKAGESRRLHFFLLSEPASGSIGSFDPDFQKARIRDSAISYRTVRPAAAFAQALQAVKENSSGGGTVYIVTDLQRITWGFKAESEAGILLKQLTSLCTVRIIGVRPEHTPVSAGVDSLTLEDRPSTAGRKSRVQAVITNNSGEQMKTRASFMLDGELYGEKEAELGPYESKPLYMDILFEKAGTAAVEVNIQDDELAGDNSMYLPVSTEESVEILAVNGETSIDVMKDETDFFKKAMNPGGAFAITDDIIINVTEVDETGFAQKDIFGYDVILLANVMRIPEQKAETLASFIEEGGSVLISAGELIDRDFYNSYLYSGGKGVMPCPLGDIVNRKGDSASYATFDIKTLSGTMLRFLSKFKSNICENIHFFRYYHIPESDKDSFRTVLRYSDGTPAVIERVSSGISCFLNFTLDEAWSGFPSHPLYLPFFREIINYCVIRGQTRFAEDAGAPVTARIPAEYAGGEFTVSGPGVSAGGIKPHFLKTRYVISWEKTDNPGFYRIEGAGYSELFSRNHRPEESILEYVNERVLTDLFPELEIEITGNNRMISGMEGEGRNIWRFLALTACILFAVEFLFAFYQSRT